MTARAGLDISKSVDGVLMPWDAVDKVTSRDYLRKSRFFLEYAGFVDPKTMYHRPGPGFAVDLEWEALRAGMAAFVRRGVEDPRFVRSLVIDFIMSQKQRVLRGRFLLAMF